MGYAERNIWASLIASVVGVTVYAVVIGQRAAGVPVARVDWVGPMAWTIGLAIAGAIALSLVWGIVAGMRDRSAHGSDERDRDIARWGDHVGQAFLVIAGLGAIVLSAIDADGFWVAHTVFAGFALSSIVGGVAQIIAYRRGMV